MHVRCARQTISVTRPLPTDARRHHLRGGAIDRHFHDGDEALGGHDVVRACRDRSASVTTRFNENA
ncbi:MAG: hypothetical protein ACR2G6_01000 [Gemmatimonadaceae bacterium]